MGDHTEIALINQKLELVVDQQIKTEKKLDGISKVLQTIALQQKDIKTLYKRFDILYQQRETDFGEGGVIDKMKTRQASCPVKEDVEVATREDINGLWRAFKWACGLGITSILILMGAILKVGH